MQVKVTEMSVGDKGFYGDNLVELRDGGKSGGCETDLYLALVAQPGDREFDEAADLPDIILDTDDVTA